jgi:hypothetical protein
MTKNTFLIGEGAKKILAEAADPVQKYNEAMKTGDYNDAIMIAATQRALYQKGDGSYYFWDQMVNGARAALRASEPPLFLEIERK